MIISKQRKCQHYEELRATLYGVELKLVDHYEYLGVILNKEMNYDAQRILKLNKTNSHLYLLKKLKRMDFGEDKLVCVYKSLTLSQ